MIDKHQEVIDDDEFEAIKADYQYRDEIRTHVIAGMMQLERVLNILDNEAQNGC